MAPVPVDTNVLEKRWSHYQERPLEEPGTALHRDPRALTAHRPPLHALTGIRFFAAAYVVLFHTSYAARGGRGILVSFAANGYLAVTLFFLLSGLILAYTYRGQIRTWPDHRRFWEARFARIWPLYAVSLLATTVVTLLIPNPIAPAIPPWPAATAVLLMVQSWDPLNLNLAAAWNMVCWTLSAEAFFYLLFPFVQTRLERMTHRGLLILLTGLVLLCLGINTAVQAVGHLQVSGPLRYVPLALVKAPEFLVGVLIGNLLLERRAAGESLNSRGALTWGSSAALAVLFCLPSGRLTSLIIPASGALLLGLSTESTALRRLLSRRAILLGGQISYGMYLLQWPCKMAVSGIADHVHLTSPVLRFAADLGLLIMIALLGFRFIENPARVLIRSMFARREANSAAH